MTDIQINLIKLSRYLANHIEGLENIDAADKFSDGQSNPTYLLSTNIGQMVLRMQPLGELLKSAHAVDREFAVISALADSEVTVARAIHLCKEREVIGSMFYVMSYEQGRVFWDPTLPLCSNEQRAQIYDEMNLVLAKLHSIDISATGLQDFGKPGNYFQRQINRWTQQYQASETSPIPSMNKLMEWLPNNMPQDDGKISLIHGDYRIDNMIFENNRPKIKALLDWELSTLGHPYSDLAYQCMQWRLDKNAVIAGMGGIDRKALGIPTEQEYVSMYCQRRQLPEIPNWNFYLVFSFFRFAAILQGIMKRYLEGNASSKKALDYGKFAPVLADMAIDLI